MRQTDREIIEIYEQKHAKIKYNELLVKIITDAFNTNNVQTKRYIVENNSDNENLYKLVSTVDKILETKETGVSYGNNEQEALGRHILRVNFYHFEDFMSEEFVNRTIKDLGKENEEYYYTYETDKGEYLIVSKY